MDLHENIINIPLFIVPYSKKPYVKFKGAVPDALRKMVFIDSEAATKALFKELDSLPAYTKYLTPKAQQEYKEHSQKISDCTDLF